MSERKPERLSAIVQGFFERHLVSERNLSPNTVLSYRDGLSLFLRFAALSVGRDPDMLTLDDMKAELVRAFLDSIETERKCSLRTRNQRLATLRSFFRYVGSVRPDHLERCRQIRDIPNKRVEHKAIKYVEDKDITAILDSIDKSSRHGLRDLTLLTLLYNTGARVQEIVDLNTEDLRLEASPNARLRGKGRKERDCPIFARTAQLLREWLERRQIDSRKNAPLFVNSRGERLTRSGVAYILNRAVKNGMPSSNGTKPMRVTPHTVRHSTAMQLLCSGVDINVIAAWLGHADISTTHGYVEINLRMKQAAIEDATAFLPPQPNIHYPEPDLLKWLDNLGKGQDYVK